MGKITENAKYLIKLALEADSLVERPDIIGAIFGQTEGLLGQDMNLKELQESGRIGRINIVFKESKDGKTRAEIIIPSNLSASETALLAASIETVDKVGYTKAKIKLIDIEDLRDSKRAFIERRSKEILEKLYEKVPDVRETLNKVEKDLKLKDIKNIKGLAAGSEVEKSDEIILVEGRADVVNLVRCGIRNAIEIGGSSVAEQIRDIVKNKTVTVFLDGDRGGDLILKRLMKEIKIDYVARAPDGKEVEELTKKELYQCLKHKKQLKTRQRLPSNLKELGEKIIKSMLGTREVKFLDYNLNEIYKTTYSELPNVLKTAELDNVAVIAMDGKLTRELAEKIEKKGIKAVLCFEREKFKTKLNVLAIHDF